MADALPEPVRRFLISDPSWSTSTRVTRGKLLRGYCRWNGGPGISKETFLLYLADLETRGKASMTRNAVGKLLKLYASVIFDMNVARWKVPKGKPNAPHPLSDDEFARLLEGIERGRKNRDLNKYRAKAARWSGLRVSECLRAIWRDVDLRRGTWTVPVGKGNKSRTIYLTREGQLVMVDWWGWLHPDRGLDDTRDPKLGQERIFQFGSIQAFEGMVRKAAQRAGLSVRRVVPHTLRKTFLTGMARAGVSIETVRKQAGHASIATTGIYVDFTGRDIEADLVRAGLR